MSEIYLPGPETRLARLVFPHQTNHLGTLFGGEALRLMDEAAAIAARRYARQSVVTVHVNEITFRAPVYAGELLEAIARVVRVGTTSMTVEVELLVEDLSSGQRRQTTCGSLVMVVIGQDGRPRPVRITGE